MGKESAEIVDIEEIAQQAHSGVDISRHFNGRFQAKQNVSVALSLELLESIDLECKRQNTSRQDWIKASLYRESK